MSLGNLFVSMLINGLGFTGRALHMYSEYFSDKPIECLIAQCIEPEHISDDALGRCLDAPYERDVSLRWRRRLCDGINHIGVWKGYSRDHRPELNQDVLNLICENNSGITVYMKPSAVALMAWKGFKRSLNRI